MDAPAIYYEVTGRFCHEVESFSLAIAMKLLLE